MADSRNCLLNIESVSLYFLNKSNFIKHLFKTVMTNTLIYYFLSQSQ